VPAIVEWQNTVLPDAVRVRFPPSPHRFEIGTQLADETSMRTLNGNQLRPEEQQAVLNSYIYRMTHESVVRWPEARRVMERGGYRLPLISDQEWLKLTCFTVRKDGRLDRRARFCHSRRGWHTTS
jgi:hypothetical protein